MSGPLRPDAAPGAPTGAPTGVTGLRRVAIGCVTAWLGLVSGAMIAALLSKVVAYLTHETGCPGIPSCDWYIYAMAGGAIGALTLPVLVLRVLGKPAKRPNTE